LQDEEYVPTPGGRSIGKYQDAVYYREGLFSAVYKAPALEDGGYFPPEAKSKVVALKVTTPSVMEPPHDSKREAKIMALAVSDWRRSVRMVAISFSFFLSCGMT
jgi:cyclin-dependent kinase